MVKNNVACKLYCIMTEYFGWFFENTAEYDYFNVFYSNIPETRMYSVILVILQTIS